MMPITRNKMLLVLALLLSSSLYYIYHTATLMVIEGCAKEPVFRLATLTVLPDPPVRGHPLRVHLEGVLKEQVNDATMQVEVHYGGIRLFRIRTDLCDFLKQHADRLGLPQCPLPEGPIVYTKAVRIPSEIPAGNYRVHAEAATADEKMLFCYDAEVDLKP